MEQVIDHSEEFRALFEQSYSEWTEQVYQHAISELEINDPLPEMCDEAQGCSSHIESEVKTIIDRKWTELFENIIRLVEVTEDSVDGILNESWDKRRHCSVEFPCCTYGPEFQYNVKVMTSEAKVNLFAFFNDFNRWEDRRLSLHHECPTDTPQSCADLGACWDGSARANDWPDCSCPSFDHDVYRCPEHDCSSIHGYNHETCQCECDDLVCDAPHVADHNNCECVCPAGSADRCDSRF